MFERLKAGAKVSSSEYILARRAQTTMRWKFEHFMASYDVLLTPTTAAAAGTIEGLDALEQARLLTRYTSPLNLIGFPGISLPCGFTSDGLPIGLQIIARPWAESLILRAAYAYEEATSWHKRVPDL